MNHDDVLLRAILDRKSIHPKMVSAPAPSREHLELIFRAAMAAPDHKALSPWHFVIIEGEDLQQFGELLAAGHKEREPDASEKSLAKSAAKALRAPMIIAVCLDYKEHPKVPHIEQVLTCGCAMQQMLLAAEALGYGASVLSGLNMYGSAVHEGLGLSDTQEVLGLFYIGTPDKDMPIKPRHEPWQYVRRWPK